MPLLRAAARGTVGRALLLAAPRCFKTTIYTHGFYLCASLKALLGGITHNPVWWKSIEMLKVGLNVLSICNRPSPRELHERWVRRI